VLAHLLTPACRFVGELEMDEDVRGYLFREGDRLAAIVWATHGTRPEPIAVTHPDIAIWDLMGRRMAARQFAPSDVPVYLVGHGLSEVAFRAALD
jgi:hypothetical protein